MAAGRDDPIGVFDSGVGGLSVVRELRALLPAEDLIYAADGAYCPYGDRSSATIRSRSVEIAAALIERRAKALVVACNTACSVALADLRAALPATPIVGLVPAVKPAALATRTGRIAVLGTTRTIGGESLLRLIREHARGVAVDLVPAPGLVELVERGEIAGPRVEALLRPLLAPLPERGVDTLVLGCTHYPFLRPTLRRLLGPDVRLIDSGEAIARRTRDVLRTAGQARQDGGAGGLRIVTSGEPVALRSAASVLLGWQIEVGRIDG